MMRGAVCSAALIALLLAGCAGNPVEDEVPQPVLTSEMLDQIRSTRVVIGVDLSSQSTTTGPNVWGTGQQLGLLGVVVDVAVQSAMESNRLAHEQLKSAIQDAAINFNFGGHFKSDFESAVRRVGWLRVASVAREPSPQRGNTTALMAQAKDDALLVADVGYVFASDFSAFTISAHTVLRLREPQPPVSGAPALDRRFFRRDYAFDYPLEQPYVDKQQAARVWAENNGAMVQRALQAGVSDTVRKIAADLETFRELTSPAQTARHTP